MKIKREKVKEREFGLKHSTRIVEIKERGTMRSLKLGEGEIFLIEDG